MLSCAWLLSRLPTPLQDASTFVLPAARGPRDPFGAGAPRCNVVASIDPLGCLIVRRLSNRTFSANRALGGALLAASLQLLPVGGAAGSPAQLPAGAQRGEAVRGQDGAADRGGAAADGTAVDREAARREASLGRIDRLKRTGKLADARRLMPMLKDPDALVRREAEQAIWLLWGRSGRADIDRLFRAGVGQIGRDEIGQAIETFTRVVDNLPTFAEAWNKRATARFLAGDLAGAMDDCERALSLVPDHFGSLAGYGHIYFRLDDLDMAILYWQRALAVNPNLLSVARSIEAAEKILARRGRLRT